MRITFVSTHDDPGRGGAEAYLAKLKERFLAHGHEVGDNGDIVFATTPHPGADFYQPHHGIYAMSIPPHYESMPWGLRHLRRWNPTRRAHFRRMQEQEAETIASAFVLALSPRVLAELQLYYPGAEGRARLLRPGVDLERFRPRRLPEGGRRVIFVAHNRRLKGYRTAERAARMAGAELLVADDGGDVAELFNRADALVHPTYYDTASLVVLEALACDVPPITTVRDGNQDLAREGGGEVLARPGDPKLLADAIERVLARREVGRARTVAERFDETKMLDEVVKCVC